MTLGAGHHRILSRQLDGDDASQCRVDVRATDTPIGGKHLFIVYTNQRGVEYGYRAGPDTLAPLMARIEGYYGRYTADMFPDYDPSAPSVTALAGPSACGKGDLFADELLRITAAKLPYFMFGRNSNTVISHLLSTSGIARVTPVPSPIGWDAELFPESELPAERRRREGGAEGASGEGREGEEGAGGAPG